MVPVSKHRRFLLSLALGGSFLYGCSCSNKPNLVIARIEPATTASLTRDGFTLAVTLENRGGGGADIVDGNRIAIRSIGANVLLYRGAFGAGILKPGESVTHFCRGIPRQTGSQTWTLRVDPDNWVEESNEDDNDRSYSLTIGPGSSTPYADLAITNIAQEPGDAEKFNVTVTNLGTGTAALAPGLEIVAENSRGTWNGVTNNALFLLPPGQSRNVIKYVTFPAGTRTFTFRADPENMVTETSETNNERTGTFTLP